MSQEISLCLALLSGASLKIYVNQDITVSGGGIINGTGLPANLSVFGLNACDDVTISGSAAFIGTVNTPNAQVTISGSGGLHGAVTCSQVTLSGGAGVHYDETLGSASGRYVVDSLNEWTEL